MEGFSYFKTKQNKPEHFRKGKDVKQSGLDFPKLDWEICLEFEHISSLGQRNNDLLLEAFQDS